MHITLMLALAGLTASVPLPEGADSTVVVLRLKCPNAADLAVCKDWFTQKEVIALAVQRYWVSELPEIKQLKDPAGWLKSHLQVRTSGKDTIRVWIKGDIPRGDRAALANAVFDTWMLQIGHSDAIFRFACFAPEYQAYEKARKRSQAAYRKLRQVVDNRENALLSKDPSAIKKQNQAEEKARKESKKEDREMDDARLKLGEVMGKGSLYFVLQLAHGPGEMQLRKILNPKILQGSHRR